MIRDRVARRCEAGIVFIGLVVTVGVMAVLLLAAVQPFSVVLQRDREDELIFRGEEYAEAIRKFQKEHGGAYPAELKVLVQPGGPSKQRYMRRLYPNPFDVEEGKWGTLAPGQTVFKPDGKGGLTPVDPANLKPGELPTGLPGGMPGTQGGFPGMPGQPGFPGATGMPGQGAAQMGMVLPFKFGGQEGQPILGVYAPQKVSAFREYMGKKNISEWAFSPLVIQPKQIQRPGQPLAPGQPGMPGRPGVPGQPGVPGTAGGFGGAGNKPAG